MSVLFADDTFIYRSIRDQSDCIALQSDIIQAIEKWSQDWLMPLNAAKTQLICFGKKNYAAQYQMGGLKILEVQTVKYLGVTLSNDLKFDVHITSKIKKATQILGLLKRALWNAPLKAKLMAYKAMCRPIIEYAAVVWDPHAKKQIYNLEMVQNRAIRFIANIKGRNISITEARPP